MFIYLSNDYAIRNESDCSYLIQFGRMIGKKAQFFDSFCIPPFMGYILSHIGDYEIEESLTKISDVLGISENTIRHFVNQLTDNEESKKFVVNEDKTIYLLPFLLSTSNDKPKVNVLEVDDFDYKGDYVIRRPYMPISINLMITTRCTTDCIYCYADRSLRPIMDTDRILTLIDEMHEAGVINITLTGGDILTRKDWSCILKKMREYGYFPFISTKTPITESEIITLRELGYDEIQFSLDTNSEEILREMVKAPTGYFQSVKEFLENSGKHGLNILVRSVLTRLNADVKLVKDFYEFLASFDAVKQWTLTPAFFSNYKADEYRHLEVNNDDLKDVYKFVHQDNLKFRIGLNKISEEGYKLKTTDNVEDFVRTNQTCVANSTGLSILANGKCSVCEMLYEEEEYLLGDVNSNTIREIWNSKKALDLYALNQEVIEGTSPCSSCKVFSVCRNGYGKKVCYVDICKSGKSLSFPDPRCPKAEEYDMVF